MASIVLPRRSRFALALREPNLLVPGRSLSGPIALRNEILRGQIKLAGTHTITAQNLGVGGLPTSVGGYPQISGDSLEFSGSQSLRWTFVDNGDFTVALMFKVTGPINIDHGLVVIGPLGWDVLVWVDTLVSNMRIGLGAAIDSTGGVIQYTSNNTVEQGKTYIVVASRSGDIYTARLYNNTGLLIESISVTKSNTIGPYLNIGSRAPTSMFDGLQGNIYGAFYASGWGANAFESDRIARNFFAAYLKPANDTPYLFPVAAGGGVSGTGDLVGAGSQVVGTGTRSVTGTGALEGQGAEVVGTATRTITGTGALVGQGSDVAGTGAAGGTHTGTGDLVGAGSEIVGVGERAVTGTGALVAQGSAVAGVGERTVTGSGDLVGAGAEVSGSGAIGGITTGTGDLVGAGSEIVGTGLRTVTGSGALVAQGSAVTGTGERTVTGAGALVGSGSEIVGAGVGGDVTTGAGALVGQGSAVTGTGTRTITGVGELVAAGSIIVGSGLRTITGSGALVGAGSAVTGSSAHAFVSGNTRRTWLLSPRGREWSLSRSN